MVFPGRKWPTWTLIRKAVQAEFLLLTYYTNQGSNGENKNVT